MLGITLADVLAIGTIIGGIVAMVHGNRDGAAGKKVSPPDPQVAILGTTMVDTTTFRDLVDVLEELNETLKLGISTQQNAANNKIVSLLEQLVEADRNPRRTR